MPDRHLRKIEPRKPAPGRCIAFDRPLQAFALVTRHRLPKRHDVFGPCERTAVQIPAVPRDRAVAALDLPPLLNIDFAEAKAPDDFTDRPRRALPLVDRKRRLDQFAPCVVGLRKLPPVDRELPCEPRQERRGAAIRIP